VFCEDGLSQTYPIERLRGCPVHSRLTGHVLNLARRPGGASQAGQHRRERRLGGHWEAGAGGGWWICELGVWSKGCGGQEESVHPIKTGDRGGWARLALDGVTPSVSTLSFPPPPRSSSSPTISAVSRRYVNRGLLRAGNITAFSSTAYLPKQDLGYSIKGEWPANSRMASVGD